MGLKQDLITYAVLFAVSIALTIAAIAEVGTDAVRGDAAKFVGPVGVVVFGALGVRAAGRWRRSRNS